MSEEGGKQSSGGSQRESVRRAGKSERERERDAGREAERGKVIKDLSRREQELNE